MQLEKTLNWFQKQAADDTIRANITTVVKDDAGNVVSTSAADVAISSANSVAAVKAAESAILADYDLTLATPAA